MTFDPDELREQMAEQLGLDESPESQAQWDAVLRAYGETMFMAQALERSLHTIFVLHQVVDADDTTIIDEALREAESKSMGKVLGELEEQGKLQRGTRRRYNNATARRNRLAHGFFVRHFTDMLTADGRAGLLASLAADRDYFIEVVAYFDKHLGVPLAQELTAEELVEATTQLARGEIDINGNPIMPPTNPD